MRHGVLCYSITARTTGNARGGVPVNPWTSVQYLQFIIVACAAFLANFAGGVFARRVADRMHLAVGFSAGTVIAVAFFIFMPQAVLCRPAAHGANELLPLVGLGFVIALLLDRFGSFWMADSEERLTTRKHYGHAVLNGAAIGLSYHVSPAVSAVVTAALLAHEFSDSADAARQGLRERSHPGKPSSASSIIDRCADVWRRGGDVSRECHCQMIRVALQETHTAW